ncbi:ATP-binding protein, partial [Halomicronema sp. CCY15110]|uniref:ATP-binding protein n=1 Tax=Halomicronema sp. CCY15110 TaxID=2767773 RepID=UPI00194F2488
AGGVAGGVALGVAGGVAGGVALGVAGGVAWILGVLRVYFWLPELLWLLCLGFLVPEGKVDRLLRWLPPQFDELIILPLPFMAEFIAQAHRQNPVAARQTLDYFITSTNQQAVAAQAMAQIAVDALARCDTVAAIAAIADELAWVPSPPPRQVGPLLPEFIEVSQAVRAAQASTSAYRQWESLGPPLRQLSQLKQGLVQQDPLLATTYGSIVENWLGVLNTAQANLQAQALRSGEIPPVYIAGAALAPDTAGQRFRGRQDLFREIETLARADAPPTLLLYGGRRTGKTSALKHLPRRVGPDLVPLLVDLQGAAMNTTLAGTAKFLATAMQQAARQARNLTLPAPDQLALEKEPFAALQQWFATIEQTARGKRFLLCLDEFERLSEIVNTTGSRAPLNFLRYIIQNQPGWILLFSGSHTPDELEPYWSDYLINTQSLRLSYLEPADARALIQHPIDDFPDVYEPEAVDAILALTRCQPYFVQLTCLVLVEYLNRLPDRHKATAADVNTIVPKVLERGGEVLRERFQTLPQEHQAILHQLASRGAISEASKASLQKLVQQEILELGDQGCQFQIPLFQRYVQSIMV